LGNLFRETRRLENAGAEYAKAAATWDKLAEKQPAAPEHRRYQGVTHNNLGMVYMAMADKLSEARAEFVKAIAIQEPLAKKHPNLSQVQSDLAASHYNLGKAEFRARQNPASVTSYQAAVRVLEKLAATHPSELAFRTRLVLAQSALANALAATGKFKEAVDASERALEVQREIAYSRATEEEHKGDLALRIAEHADVLRRAGDIKGADKAYHDAIEIQKKLVADKGDVLRYSADLAESYNNLGLLRMRQRQDAAAEKAFTQALEIWETLQKKFPESAECGRGIAGACTNLRALTRSSEGYQIALEPLGRVIGVYASVVRNSPEPALALALFHAHWARAEARTARAQFDGAVQDWDQALALAPNLAEKTWVRIYRSTSQARYGEAEAAVKEADEILPLLKDNVPDAFFQLARTYAVAATTESKKNGEGAEEAKQRAERNAEQATKLLERLRDLKYFEQAERRQKLSDSIDWQFLRGRPSFQTLLRNVQVSKTVP
jgi:tetratricopeptide (TPR) repeat protein